MAYLRNNPLEKYENNISSVIQLIEEGIVQREREYAEYPLWKKGLFHLLGHSAQLWFTKFKLAQLKREGDAIKHIATYSDTTEGK